MAASPCWGKGPLEVRDKGTVILGDGTAASSGTVPKKGFATECYLASRCCVAGKKSAIGAVLVHTTDRLGFGSRLRPRVHHFTVVGLLSK